MNKGLDDLNSTIQQLDLVDFHRPLHPTAVEYIFFSSAHGTFTNIDHILSHKANLTKAERIEITQNIFSDHNRIKQKLTTERYLENSQMFGS